MELNTKVYTIELNNYHGDSYAEHYLNSDKALNRFNELKEEGKMLMEFASDSNGFSFFDCGYNEYSTIISFHVGTVKNLFVDIEE